MRRSGAKAFGWALDEGSGRATKPTLEQPASRSKKRGVGICAGFEGTAETCGSDPGMAEIVILGDGNVICWVGVTEIGAGENTVLAQIAAEELGAPLDSTMMSLGDTRPPRLTPARSAAA